MRSGIKNKARDIAIKNKVFGKIYSALSKAKQKNRSKLSDEEYLKVKFRENLGRELNLDNPAGYCEKLQWLKLHDHNPIYHKMVDKYEAKKFVTDRVGEGHVIPLVGGGVWNKVGDIDFDTLPDQFVLKVTHDCGGLVVCPDKSKLDIEKAKKILSEHYKSDYYATCREWAYKDVQPRIIAEKYEESLGKPDSTEYKVTCFNGKVEFITVCRGIAHSTFGDRTNDSFDVDFNHMPWYAFYKNAKVQPEKPQEWDELIRISEILSKDVPVLRVDCYVIDGTVYVGEMTFYTWAGFIEFNPPEWNEILGAKIKLPKIK